MLRTIKLILFSRQLSKLVIDIKVRGEPCDERSHSQPVGHRFKVFPAHMSLRKFCSANCYACSMLLWTGSSQNVWFCQVTSCSFDYDVIHRTVGLFVLYLCFLTFFGLPAFPVQVSGEWCSLAHCMHCVVHRIRAMEPQPVSSPLLSSKP